MIKFGKLWSWCNEVRSVSSIEDKHIDSIYRIDATACSPGSCKNNCGSNPYCLNGIGEKKVLNLLQKESSLSIDRSKYFREINEYAGLINLGATCYINTYLQVWYNNIIFREYILQASFNQDLLEEENIVDDQLKYDELTDNMPTLKLKVTNCIGKSLQILFALMKESKRRSIDPNFFIKALGLDENMQQDAQEFSQLFLTTLQSSLPSAKSNTSPSSISTFFHQSSNIINEMFQGECSYITECKTCNNVSVRHCNFIELSLSLQNCSTITECMDDLLKPEMMHDDNQYYCSNCAQKRDATRKTRLTELPPVLNLQLLRFVYDRSSGYKKKLSTKIKFTEVLDLTKYTKDSDKEKSLYHLGAILMHVGKTCTSGHYMAQIKNFHTSEWYNFNDEVITVLKKKQQLGSTEEETQQVTTSSQKSTNQFSVSLSDSVSNTGGRSFSTANAYLLVYYRSDFLKQTQTTDSVVSNFRNKYQIVNKDNILLEEWFDRVVKIRNETKELQLNECEMISTVYNNLWVNDKNPDKPKIAVKASKSINPEVNKPDETKQSTKVFNAVDIKQIKIPTLSFYGSVKQKEDKELTNLKTSILDSSDGDLQTEDYFFIHTEYLRKLLSLQSKLVDTSSLISINSIQKYMCQHKRLNPLAVNKFKIVRREGVDLIRRVLSVDLADLGVLDTRSMVTTKCRQCVVNCFEYIRCKEKIKTDSKLLKNLLKSEFFENTNECGDLLLENVVENELSHEKILDEKDRLKSGQENKENTNGNCSSLKDTWYWVGKDSLRLWSSLALKKFEARLPSNQVLDQLEEVCENISEEDKDSEDSKKADNLNDKPRNQNQKNVNFKSSMSRTESSTGQENNSINLSQFNEDLMCPHMNLTATNNKRLVNSAAWRIFETYFESSFSELGRKMVFTSYTPECMICQKHLEDNDTKKTVIKGQKDFLKDLYLNKSRPDLAIDQNFNSVYYLVPSEFLKIWRAIIKQSKFRDVEINNKTILCPHNKLAFDETSIDTQLVTLITEEEWLVLSSSFKYDQPIKVYLVTKSERSPQANPDLTKTATENNVETNFKTSTETLSKTTRNIFQFDPEICLICIEQNALDKFLFYNKKLAIRQIDEDEMIPTSITEEMYGKRAAESAYFVCKKARLNLNLNDNLSSGSATKKQWIDDQNTKSHLIEGRRSKRSRKCKGDIEIFASSSDTVKELKVQIFTKITRMISEQHLFFKGVELENEKVLAHYRIHHTDILRLKLDPVIVSEDSEHVDEVYLPEVGFKGTNLISWFYKGMTEYFATYGRGTLSFVQNELKSINSLEIKESDIEGKILFSTSLSVSSLYLLLKTVERVCLSILFHKVPNNSEIQRNQVLSLVETSINSKLFNSQNFIQILKKTPKTQPESKKVSREIKFRVNCKLTGKWKIAEKSTDLRSELKNIIIKKVCSFNQRFEFDEDEADFEVICHLTDKLVCVGVPISKITLSNRSYIRHVGLRSTICSMMLQAAFQDIDSNFTFILDPFCGKGTILTEFLSNSLKQAYFLASDADLEQVTLAQENVSYCKSKQFSDLIGSNLTFKLARLPYRDRLFDLVITDLPFEKNHHLKYFENIKSIDNLDVRRTFYRSAVEEFSRLLIVDGGVLVVLVSRNEMTIFEEIVNESPSKGFLIVSNVELSLGKTRATMFKLIRYGK